MHRVPGEIRASPASRNQAVRIAAINGPALQHYAGAEQGRTRSETDGDPTGRTRVPDRVADRERDADDDGRDSDAIEPACADDDLER